MANIFSDNFNRADNTDLGVNWTGGSNFFQIVNNEVTRTGQFFDDVKRITTSTPNANYTVECDVRLSDGDSRPGVFARFTGTDTTNSSYYGLRITPFSPFSLSLGLLKIVSITETLLASTVLSFVFGQVYKLKIQVDGTEIKGFLDGVLKLTANNSDISSLGNGGIFCSSSSTNTFWDNFSVDELLAGFPDELFQTRRVLNQP